MISSNPNDLLTVPPPNTIAWGSRASTYQFWADKNIQSIVSGSQPVDHSRFVSWLPFVASISKQCSQSMKCYSGLLKAYVTQMVGFHGSDWVGGRVPSCYCRGVVKISVFPRSFTQEACFVLTEVPRSLASHSLFLFPSSARRLTHFVQLFFFF